MRRILGTALLVLAPIAAVVAGARADAHPPPPVCPTTPPADAAGCRRAMACRYPERGVVCVCERFEAPGGRARRHWVCGELGE